VQDEPKESYPTEDTPPHSSAPNPESAPDPAPSVSPATPAAANPQPAAVTATPAKPVPWALYGRLGGFLLMLGLAVAGMILINREGNREAPQEGNYVWIYWIAVVAIYTGVSLFRGYTYGRLKGGGLKNALGGHFMHWGGLIIVVGVMMWLVNYGEVPARTGANVLVLLLALTCYLAGVHFDRLFMVLGVFLGVIALLASLEGAWWIWVMAVAVCVGALAVGYFYFRHEDEGSSGADA
jgi:hypothetical protein